MDEHAQTVGNFLDDRHAESRRRIAALEMELEAAKRDAALELADERERREAAEALLRSGYTTAELIAHFARYKD